LMPVLESWLHARRQPMIRMDAGEMEPGCPGQRVLCIGRGSAGFFDVSIESTVLCPS
jgi:hypothetical protein